MSASQKTWFWIWLAGYAGLLAGVIGGMLWVRQSVLTEFSRPESIADWQSWREDVIEGQTSPGPVERRVPKSLEPPALVLMRDYFTVSIVGATFFTSILYWIAAWFVTGALRTGE
jgi:hypothetical protein